MASSPPSWIKLNSDGLAKGSPGPAAIGGLFRNSNGHVIGAFYKSIGIQTAFFAELEAVISGIEFAWINGWHRLWIESDWTTVISYLLGSCFHPPWPLVVRWHNCIKMLAQMWLFCTHIYREGNSRADKLSKLGILHQDMKWWSASFQDIHTLISRDMCGLPNYRFRNGSH